MATRLSRKKKAIFIFMAFVLATLVLEFSAFLIHWPTKGELFSFARYHKKRASVMKYTGHALKGFGAKVWEDGTREVIHPYLGFVRDPSQAVEYSEYGFFKPNILDKAKDEISVVILGGSFAAGTFRAGKETLVEELKKYVHFKDENIAVYPMAMGGYKQPQQLFALMYFITLSASFDIVINLDGFNEIVLPHAENINKNVFPYYPRSWFSRVDGYFDKKLLFLSGEISVIDSRRRDFAHFFARMPLCYSVIGNLIWDSYDQDFLRQKVVKILEIHNYQLTDESVLDYTITGPPYHHKDEQELFVDLAKFWVQCSMQMQKVCVANGSRYFHFLQPNQYVPGSKIMGKEELKIAICKDHPYGYAAINGYPQLIKHGRSLLTQKVAYWDLTMIFAEISEPLYIDDCCHVSDKGYRMVAAHIGKTIVEYLSLQEKEE